MQVNIINNCTFIYPTVWFHYGTINILSVDMDTTHIHIKSPFHLLINPYCQDYVYKKDKRFLG